MKQHTSDVLFALVVNAISVVLLVGALALAPQAAEFWVALVAWIVTLLAILGAVAGADQAGKDRARALISAWREGYRDQVAPRWTTVDAIKRGASLAVAIGWGACGHPWLGLLWLVPDVIAEWSSWNAHAFVRSLDDEVRRQLVAYEEATQDAV